MPRFAGNAAADADADADAAKGGVIGVHSGHFGVGSAPEQATSTDSAAAVPPAHYPIVALTELFYPKATVGDVVTLAIRWNERLASAMRAKPGALVAAATAWHRIVDDVTATTRGVAPDQVYAHGHAFWDGLSVLAMAMDEVLAPEAFALRIAAGRVRSRVEDLPGTLTRGAESAGDSPTSVR